MKEATDCITKTKPEAHISSGAPYHDCVDGTPIDLHKLITRQKVAEYLKVSIQSVINYTNRGLLVAHKIGRRVLYNEDEVVAAIQSCTVKRYQHESTRLYIFKK